MKQDNKFWQVKSLKELNTAEWESICDGCGKCCLNTFIDSEAEEEFSPTDVLREGEKLIYTNIVCHLLDTKTCSCSQYERRTEFVPSCVQLTKDNIQDIFFMPQSCSYRRLYEGRGLASWHPLLNKNKKSKMHAADISVRGKVVLDRDVNLDDFENYIVKWPEYDKD